MSWGRDALAAGALAAVIDQAGQITGRLAIALAEIENALETQADTAAGHGVVIMPGGQPGPEPDGPPGLAALSGAGKHAEVGRFRGRMAGIGTVQIPGFRRSFPNAPAGTWTLATASSASQPRPRPPSATWFPGCSSPAGPAPS